MGRWRRALALATGLAVAGACGAGCSSDAGEDRSGASAETTTSSTAPAPGPPTDPAVVGTWTADGADELVAVLSDQGLDEAPTCDGTVTLELGPDGAFHRTSAGTCDFGADEGEVELEAAGGYTTEGGELVLTDVSGSGTIRGAGGDELAVPDQQVAEGGAIGYRVSGDELVLSLGGEDGSQTFTRG